MQEPALGAGERILAVAGAEDPVAPAGVVLDAKIVPHLSSGSRFHHSPKTRSGPSARFTRRRIPRQVKDTGGWSGSRATVSIGSGGASRRDGRGQWPGHSAPVSGESAGIRRTERSGTSLATGAAR